eukprot:1151289-Pelagomonas_calceolata.AAC.2
MEASRPSSEIARVATLRGWQHCEGVEVSRSTPWWGEKAMVAAIEQWDQHFAVGTVQLDALAAAPPMPRRPALSSKAP